MNAPIQFRQVAQYPREDAAIAGTVALMQMGEAGSPYASILVRDLVTSALAAGGNLNLAAANGQIAFVNDFGAGAVTLSVSQGELLVSTALRTSMLNATFVNAQSVSIGGFPAVTAPQLAAVAADNVRSFNFRQGDVQLEEADILRAGGAPIANPNFSGWVTAPSHWDVRTDDNTVATARWVHDVLRSGCFSVRSFNGRAGCVTLTTADVNAAYAVPGPPFPTASNPALGDASSRIATTLFVDESLADLHMTISDEQLAILTSTYAPLSSPQLTGIPTAPTAGPGTSTGQLATTAFVMNAITDSTTGVASFNGRTGAVLLDTADITAAGGALLASPVFSGSPTAPTAAPGTSSNVLATTAFVQAALTVEGGVTSFNTRTGAVVLTLADVQATNILTNTPLLGVPTAPTAAPGTASTQIATTAFVAASSAAGVTSFMSRTGTVTLTAADVSAAGGALNASPVFTGTPAAPTAAPGTSTTQLATTAFVQAALAATGVTTFNGRAGAVTLSSADITGAGGALLASPVFTGTPAAPTAAPGTNTTQIATTAFVAAALAAATTPGWTFSLATNASTMVATGTAPSIFRIGSAAGANSLIFENPAGGVLATIGDNSSNSGANTLNYPILRNGLSGQPVIITVGGLDANKSIQLTPIGTGTVQAPTMAPGTNSTAIASTAFVNAAIGGAVVRSYLAGLTLSTAGSSATFFVTAGVAADSTNARMMTSTATTSKTTSAWAAGVGTGALDTGTIANNTWYHAFIIERTDTGNVDFLISLSATAPTMPANYTLFRRIGSMLTNASGQWTQFNQLGDEFLWLATVGDVNVTNLGTGAVAYTLTVPTGVQVHALGRANMTNATASMSVLVNSPDQNAETPGTPAGNASMTNPLANVLDRASLTIRTSTLAQIRAIATAASTTFTWDTHGWIDRRGRDA